MHKDRIVGMELNSMRQKTFVVKKPRATGSGIVTEAQAGEEHHTVYTRQLIFQLRCHIISIVCFALLVLSLLSDKKDAQKTGPETTKVHVTMWHLSFLCFAVNPFQPRIFIYDLRGGFAATKALQPTPNPKCEYEFTLR